MGRAARRRRERQSTTRAVLRTCDDAAALPGAFALTPGAHGSVPSDARIHRVAQRLAEQREAERRERQRARWRRPPAPSCRTGTGSRPGSACPSSRAAGARPDPGKTDPASIVMTTGMSIDARITSGPRMLGSTWCTTMRGNDAPRMRSASRNGALFSVSTCARATRPKCGVSVIATMITTIRSTGRTPRRWRAPAPCSGTTR